MNFCSTRLKDPGFAYSLWQKLEDADRDNSRARAQVASMINGEPPFDDEELADAMQGDAANFNTREAQALLQQEKSAYHDLIAARTLATFVTDYTDPLVRREKSLILAEEYTRLLRSWDAFNYWYGVGINHMVDFGVGFIYWGDETDFRFKATGWCDFKIPFDTPATEAALTIVAAKIPKEISELMEALDNTAGMDEESCLWDREQLKAIVKEEAKKVIGDRDRLNQQWDNWEYVERMVKENPTFFSGSMSSRVWFINFWIIEEDGKVSHALLQDPGEGGNGACWLYFNYGRFDNIAQCMVVLPYDEGQGTYHSIRGRGWVIQPQVQANTILTCRMADGAADSTRKLLQVTNPASSDFQNMALARVGDNEYLPAGIDFVQRSFPDYSRTILPVIQHLERQLNKNNTGAKPTVPALDRNAPALSHQLEAQSNAAVSASALNRFYLQLDKVHKEIVRRITDPLYDRESPGGDLVYSFKKRLKQRGAMDAINHIVEVKATRVVGAGSSANRLLAFQRLMALAGSFDEMGRRNLVEDLVAEEVGYENVERYLPPISPEEQRVSVDVKIAEFENFLFKNKQASEVFPNQEHFSHINMHLPPLINLASQVDKDWEAVDLPALIEMYDMLMVALPHCARHVELLAYDSSRKSEAKKIIQVLQEVTAFSDRVRNKAARLSNAIKAQEEAELQRQQTQQAAYVADLERKLQQQQQSGESSIDTQRKLMEAYTKAQMKDLEFQQKLQHRQAEFDQKQAFKDAELSKALMTKLASNPSFQ